MIKIVQLSVCPICSSKKSKLIFKNIYTQDYLNDLDLPNFSIYSCSTCKIFYLNPRPTGSELSRLYPKQYFKSVLSKDIRLTGQGRYLEIGPGDGEVFWKNASSGKYAQLWVADVSADALAPFKKHKQIQTILGGADELVLKKEYFRSIYMAHVIEHVVDPVKVIKKLYNALAPGGEMEINTPNFYGLCNFVLKDRSYYSCPQHLYFFSTESLVRILKKLKIKNYRIEMHWGNMLSNRYPRLIKWILTPMVIALEKLFKKEENIRLFITKPQ